MSGFALAERARTVYTRVGAYSEFNGKIVKTKRMKEREKARKKGRRKERERVREGGKGKERGRERIDKRGKGELKKVKASDTSAFAHARGTYSKRTTRLSFSPLYIDNYFRPSATNYPTTACHLTIHSDRILVAIRPPKAGSHK